MATGTRRRRESSWQRLTEGLRLQELWTQFSIDARDGYAQYAREVDWDAIAARRRWRRPLAVARVLAWAMILKLTPARRIFLLLACLLAALAAADMRLLGWPRGFEMLLAFAALLVLLALELADRVGMKRDLELAREIQRWLLPEAPPRLTGADVAFATRPANTVGGDFYDVLVRPSPDGGGSRLLLAVADVAGKSVPAALLMANFAASFRALASSRTDIAEIVRGLNAAACAQSQGGRRFVTAFVAEYEPASRRLAYVGAGHNAPLLRRREGVLVSLADGGIPLGVDGAAAYPTSALTLEPGDLLVVYTDGVIDAVNERDEQYGEQRLLEQIALEPEPTADGCLRRLAAGVIAFAGAARQSDDITWLVLRVP